MRHSEVSLNMALTQGDEHHGETPGWVLRAESQNAARNTWAGGLEKQGPPPPQNRRSAHLSVTQKNHCANACATPF